MRNAHRLAIPAAAAVVLALSACGSGDDASHGSMSGMGGTPAATSPSVVATGASGDVAFAQMMIPHHEQAVEMATLALEHDTASEDVKALARQIEAAQDPEIQTMKQWLSQWGATTSAPMDHGSDGMMTQEQMKSLMSASGAEFNRMWLTMMIAHHEGAVAMAQDVLATTDNADVKELATAIVEAQQKEIATMQGMLA